MQSLQAWKKSAITVSLALMLGACGSGTQIKRVQALATTADAPYKKILVISMFEAFDNRKYLEKELVTLLAGQGIEAVASTSMMNSTVPATRQTFVAMLDKFDADAVLISQLATVDTDVKVKNMRPESTYNFRPTYYYNVWSVELTEYVEPKSVAVGYSIVLATQVYSVHSQEPVWAIESTFRYAQDVDQQWDYSIFPQQAESIVAELSRDGLIGP